MRHNPRCLAQDLSTSMVLHHVFKLSFNWQCSRIELSDFRKRAMVTIGRLDYSSFFFQYFDIDECPSEWFVAFH